MVKARHWALGLAVLPLVACKLKESSETPSRDVRSWTIAEIESELARNDQELAGEGIVIAMATPPEVPTSVPGPAVEEPAPEQVGEEAGTEPAGDDDGAVGPEPTAHPSEPQPTPSIAPPSAYESEALTSDSPSLTGAERREGRRRLSSRRDTDTRCERVCRLAEATCELETQICELAARHPDEPRYAQACMRAEQQCEAATRACRRCED